MPDAAPALSAGTFESAASERSWLMQHRLGMSYFSVSTGVVAIALSGILAKWAAIPGEASAFWRMLIATGPSMMPRAWPTPSSSPTRSEEHTSELQSRFDLVCRLLLEKKKKKKKTYHISE